MAIAASEAKDEWSFGPFRLVVGERLLTKEGVPVELGGRALDILIALMSMPNEVVSKKHLMSRVWSGVTVEDGSLRVHMASLRKALGDGKGKARYITTVVGRGYCFVAPIRRSSARREGAPVAAAHFPHANLPARLGRMVGRDDDVLKLSAQLTPSRLVTIVGSGGVGKTTVAVAVAHHLEEAFAGSILFVDLGMLSDPKLAATAVASLLGLPVQSDDATPGLIAYLRDKRILLILDTCEHLIEAIAALAESIMKAAPQVHILATSRETLRVEGEHVYRLDALACPPEGPGLTAAAMQKFPATQLFVQRAMASGAHLSISDLEAPIVADICRKLDGVALAIELAARRVDTYGLQQTAALLDQRLTLLWRGSRTAPSRHKTLYAALDWSYGLLSELERLVLRRLAVFVGHFTLDAALEVVTSATLDRSTVFGAIDSLAAKSMVATDPIGAMVRYRLLDTTRAYALDIDTDDATDLAVRHATYYRRWLERAGTEWDTLSTGTERTPHFAALNNVRAALEWCFGESGDVTIGIELAAAAAPVFLAMSVLTECHRWSERAILALDERSRGGVQEMRLQTALGVSLIFTRGGQDATRVALARGLALAEDRGDVLEQVRLLGPLSMFHRRIGEYNTALQYAKRCSALARTTEDSVAIVLAHSILGGALQPVGDLTAARTELEAAVAHGSGSVRNATIHFGMDGHVLAGASLAMNLWLQGHPAQAVERARQTMQQAARTGHAVSTSTAWLNAIAIYLWIGDLASASEHIDMLISYAESHSFDPICWLGRGFKGEVAIHRGDAEGGVEALESSLERLHQAPYKLFTSRLNISLIQGLAMMGRFTEGSAFADEAMRRIETNGDACYMPELLRVKGGLLLSMGRPSVDAEMCFAQSLELSRLQGARAWELRSAIDLAALWAGHGRSGEGRALLRPVFEQFTEGSDTADLKAAEHLLAALG